jgi:hypothetical protein
MDVKMPLAQLDVNLAGMASIANNDAGWEFVQHFAGDIWGEISPLPLKS